MQQRERETSCYAVRLRDSAFLLFCSDAVAASVHQQLPPVAMSSQPPDEDDSLRDVEDYIAEVESYLQQDGLGAWAGRPPPQQQQQARAPPRPQQPQQQQPQQRQHTTVTIGGRQYSTGAYDAVLAQAPQRTRPAHQQHQQQQQQLPPQPSPVPSSSYSALSTPRGTDSLSGVSSLSASVHSTPIAPAAPAAASYFDQLDRDASTLSTPSSVSSASVSAASSFHVGGGNVGANYSARSVHGEVQPESRPSSRGPSTQSSPAKRSTASSISAVSSLASHQSSPRSRPSNAFRPENVAAASAANDVATEKQRIVAQLLKQHRAAQVTGRALTSNATPAAASASLSAASSVAPSRVSSVLAPNVANMDKTSREAIVERLLRERRAQKQAAGATSTAAPSSAAAASATSPRRSAASPRSQRRSSPRTSVTDSQVSPRRDVAARRNAQAAWVEDVPPSPPAASASHMSPRSHRQQRQQQSYQSPQRDHNEPDVSHRSDMADDFQQQDESVSADFTASSSLLHASSASPPRSGATSPVDARFRSGRGMQQTIFDAADYFDEEGHSIAQEPDHRDELDSALQTQRSAFSEASEYERNGVQSSRERWADQVSPPPLQDSYAGADESQYPEAQEYIPSDISSASSARTPHSHTTTTMAGGMQRRATSRPASATRARGRAPSVGAAARGKPPAAGGAAPASQRGKSATRAQSRPVSADPFVDRPMTLRPSSGSEQTPARVPGVPTGASHSRYSRAAIVASIERERAETCTFTPNLVSSSKKKGQQHVPAASLEERLALWQQRQAAALHRKLEAKREYEEEKLAECTFAPMINPASAMVAAAKPDRARGEPVAERLHHEADQRAVLREKARRMNEEEMLASLPFAPQLPAPATATGAKIVQKVGAQRVRPLYQRVAELQKQKNERLHIALLQSREEELGLVPSTATGARAGPTSPTGATAPVPMVPFQPRVNPVSERLAREREAKERAQAAGSIADAQREQDALDDPSTATPTAQSVARLADAASNTVVLSKLKLADAQAQALAQAHPFKPIVNPVSEKLVASSPLFAGEDGRDFLARQSRLQAASAAAAAERARIEALQTKQRNTFKPDIGNADAVLAASKWRTAVAAAVAAGAPPEDAALFLPDESARRSPEAHAERLSSLESRELTLLKSKLQQVHDAAQGLTFKPEISQVSRKLAEQRAAALEAQGGPVAESQARKMAAKLLAEKQAADFRASHPFKPALSAASTEMIERGLVAPRYDAQGLATLTRSLKEAAAERDAKLSALARVSELQELRECTFSPSRAVEASLGRELGAVPRAVKDAPNRPVLVRGMNRFLELKALHKRQQQEVEERKRKVFLSDIYDYEVAPDGTPIIGPAATGAAATPVGTGSVGGGVVPPTRTQAPAGAPDGYTKPQPFILSHESRAAQRAEQAARAERDAREEERRECTFRPATTTQQQRQLIDQILKEDGAAPRTL